MNPDAFSTSARLSRRTLLQAGAAVAGIGLFGVPQSRAEEAKPQRGGTLKLGLDGGSTSDVLDPATYASALQIVLARSWGDFLLQTDPVTGAAVPSLAESWETAEAGAVWKFKIRKGVRFHDGRELKPADVAATLLRHKDPKTGSNASAYLQAIKTIAEDGDLVVVTLEESNVDFAQTLTAYQLVIQPEGGAGNPNAGIGTGPYKIVSFEPGLRVLMERNKEDWRDDRGWVDSVELIAMNDVSSRTAAIVSGRVHYVNAMNPKTIALLGKSPNIEVINSPSRAHYTMPMIVDQKPFDNIDLRLALKYATDREKILSNALGGFGTIGNDFPVNAAFDLFPADIEQRAYDPDKASFHFKKSGVEGPIQLHAADVMAGGMEMAQIFQNSARAAGIEIDLQRVPADGYWSNIWRMKPFCISYWGVRLTQDMIYSLQQAPGASTNETKFADPNVGKLIKLARSEMDPAKRKQYYHDLAVIVRDEGGTIIPVFNNFLGALSKKVRNYVPDVGNDVSNGYIASRVWLES